MDPNELKRRLLWASINAQIEEGATIESEKERLSQWYDKVYDTKELTESFDVIGFQAPFVIVKQKSTKLEGLMMFQHRPRLYYGFQAMDDRRLQ